jgi:hypothetical protein
MERDWEYGQSRPVAASGGQANATKNATDSATDFSPKTATDPHARRMLRFAAVALTARLNVIAKLEQAS